MIKRINFCAHFTRLMVGFANTNNQSGQTSRHARQRLVKPLLGGILLAAAVVLASSSSQAGPVTYEGFPYIPSGPLSIDGQSGGTGWDANWGQFLGGAFSYAITNGSLASGSLFTSSNMVTSAGGFAGRFFTIPGNWAAPSAIYYFSILIRPENTPATNHYYGLQILSNGGDTGSGHDVFVGKTGASLNYGLEYATNDITGSSNVFVHTYSSVAAASNQTVLLVVKLEFNFGGPENFSLYVNPTPGNPEPVTPDAVITNDIGTQNGLAMNMGNGAIASFDEIRLGNTFASVTPTTGVADPDLLTYEPFAYIPGTGSTSLNAQPSNGTQGSNGWDNVTWGQFLGGANNYTIGQGSLADPGNLLLTTGNCTRTTTNGGFAGRFNVYTGLPGHTNVNPTYYSVLIRPDNLGATNGISYLQIFGQPNGNDLLAGKLSGSTFWGLQSGTTLTNLAQQAFSTVPVVSNQTTFLVVRANCAPPGTPFTIQLYVNPTPGAPEPVTPDATYTYTETAFQNGLAFNTQNGAAASYDEIRVGTNYADVTPAVAVATNTNKFNITSITRVGNSIVLTWNTTAGNTNVVQATSGSNGNYNTNGFVNISGQMVIAGVSGAAAVTNYVDTFGGTNQPSYYYRVRQLP